MDVKEEYDDEYEEWSWTGWEPEPADPYEPGDHDPKSGASSSHGQPEPPLPPPPPPPPGPELSEPNPKSLSWDDYNSNSGDRAGYGWKGWGHGWKDQSWKWKDKGWHEPWNHKNSHKKAPWAKRKRTAEGEYVKGGFRDQQGNFWECLVLSSCFCL